MVHRVHGDIRTGVAAADQQYPFATEYLRAAIVRGVHHLTGEVARQLRPVGFVQRTVGDQHAVESALQCVAVTLGGDQPAVPVGTYFGYPGAEFLMPAPAAL